MPGKFLRIFRSVESGTISKTRAWIINLLKPDRAHLCPPDYLFWKDWSPAVWLGQSMKYNWNEYTAILKMVIDAGDQGYLSSGTDESSAIGLRNASGHGGSWGESIIFDSSSLCGVTG